MKPRDIAIMILLIVTVITVVLVIAERRHARLRASRPEFRVDWEQVEDDPEETLTISWMGIPRFATGKDDTWVERNLEDRFNVEFEPIFIDQNAYTRRKPLMFASGLVPDVFWDGDPVDIQRDTYHGFVVELP